MKDLPSGVTMSPQGPHLLGRTGLGPKLGKRKMNVDYPVLWLQKKMLDLCIILLHKTDHIKGKLLSLQVLNITIVSVEKDNGAYSDAGIQ